METTNYSKNVPMKGLILFAAIEKTYAALNLHGKDNIGNIIFY